mmetsp:Transcript_34694/g.75931  ORF Transcript_34694/g.75931 Transcript_34694/m.75931 type:complete len:285 (-) Transcript_34694:170-1024(-)
MTALTTILTFDGALRLLALVFTEGAVVSFRTVTSHVLLLSAGSAVSTEMGKLALAGDATNFGCLILAPLSCKQVLRVEQVGCRGAVTESSPTCAEAIVLLKAGSAMVAVLAAALVEVDLALNAGMTFGTDAVHAALLLLLEEVEVVNLLVLLSVVLEAVDALPTLLAGEVTLLGFALLLGNLASLLNLAVRSLEAVGTGTLLVNVGVVIAARSAVGAEPLLRLEAIVARVADGGGLHFAVLAGEEAVGLRAVASPLSVLLLTGALPPVEAGRVLVAALDLGLAR